jgi:hypothetical protein
MPTVFSKDGRRSASPHTFVTKKNDSVSAPALVGTLILGTAVVTLAHSGTAEVVSTVKTWNEESKEKSLLRKKQEEAKAAGKQIPTVLTAT